MSSLGVSPRGCLPKRVSAREGVWPEGCLPGRGCMS